MSDLTPTQLAIVAEIKKALRQLGAGIGIQAAVGSWGDTLDEDEVLELLRHENNSQAGGPPGSQPGCATTPRTHKTKGAAPAAEAGAVPTMKYEK